MTGAMLQSGGGMVKPVSDGYDAWYIDQVLNICLARWLNPAIVPQMCRALEMRCERKRDRQVLMMLRKSKQPATQIDEIFRFIERLLRREK